MPSPFHLIASLLLVSVTASAAEGTRLSRPTDVSLRHEVQRAIEKGVDFLKTTQHRDGWWSTPDHPAVTALALSAMLREPQRRQSESPEARKGYEFLLRCAKADGGIYVTNLANYNTALSVMALLATGDSRYDDLIRKARAYIVGSQVDGGERGVADSPFDGGIGYSNREGRSDMNNTLVALEALYYSRHLAEDRNLPGVKDLNWSAAIQFIQNCQHLPGTNRQDWVAADPRDRGGFVYDPESTKVEGATDPRGRVALRAYGSISYAGLLSYAYASLGRSDPRVHAVLEWLKSNATLEENPGMGPQGYYYYLHLMTKALTAAHIDEFVTKGGRTMDWRREVALRLIDLQKGDGSWQNDNGRWWEKDANLVTAYSVMAMELIHRGM